MKVTINFYSVFIFALILYGFFQTGRVYDDKRYIVSQPEYNHMVYMDHCEVVTDTTGKVLTIWHDDIPYRVDYDVFHNL